MVSAKKREGPERFAAAPNGPSGSIVLVVDDDLAAGAATQATLAAGGFRVDAESVGDTVLRLVRALLVKIVVSELHIVCAEGPCVVMALKRDRRRLPQLRVLVHTRHVAPADLEWALAAGADAVVPKHARSGVLVREVRRLLLDGGVAA